MLREGVIKGLIIAAGRGSRLKEMTQDTPKPLVSVNNSCFFENTVKCLKDVGISDIGAVVGYKKELFAKYDDINFFENNDYLNNNILHSLFCARKFMDDDIIIAYGDIWFEQKPFDLIAKSKEDFVLSVDSDWKEYYVGRTEHPISEAENAHYDHYHHIHDIGKNVHETINPNFMVGEFMGLLKISKRLIRKVIIEFESLENTLSNTEKFQNALEFQKAYLTDFIRFLISKSYEISCVVNSRGWYEIDTIQDMNNLKRVFDCGE